MTKTTEQQLHVLSIEECADAARKLAERVEESIRHDIEKGYGCYVKAHADLNRECDVPLWRFVSEGVVRAIDDSNLLHTVESLREQLAAAQAVISVLRKRIHNVEQHNQHFERCESAWCNPSDDVPTKVYACSPEYALAAHDRAKDERIAALEEALQNMVAVADQDGWKDALTGRQIVLAYARAILVEKGGK